MLPWGMLYGPVLRPLNFLHIELLDLSVKEMNSYDEFIIQKSLGMAGQRRHIFYKESGLCWQERQGPVWRVSALSPVTVP